MHARPRGPRCPRARGPGRATVDPAAAEPSAGNSRPLLPAGRARMHRVSQVIRAWRGASTRMSPRGSWHSSAAGIRVPSVSVPHVHDDPVTARLPQGALTQRAGAAGPPRSSEKRLAAPSVHHSAARLDAPTVRSGREWGKVATHKALLVIRQRYVLVGTCCTSTGCPRATFSAMPTVELKLPAGTSCLRLVRMGPRFWTCNAARWPLWLASAVPRPGVGPVSFPPRAASLILQWGWGPATPAGRRSSSRWRTRSHPSVPHWPARGSSFSDTLGFLTPQQDNGPVALLPFGSQAAPRAVTMPDGPGAPCDDGRPMSRGPPGWTVMTPDIPGAPCDRGTRAVWPPLL